MTTDSLSQMLADFLDGAHAAAVVEDGAIVHPATDTIPRYLSPEIDWELLGIDERWREEIQVVFRKKPVRMPHLAIPA
jgi:hypothetical protein